MTVKMVSRHGTLITMPGVHDGEDGEQACHPGQQHGASVESFPAEAVQQEDGRTVADELHNAGGDEVDPHSATQVGHVQTESVVRHADH